MKLSRSSRSETINAIPVQRKKISIRIKLLLLSLLIISGNGFIGYAVYKSNQKIRQSEQAIRSAEKIIRATNNLAVLAKDVENAARAYVLTDDNAFLNTLLTAKKTSDAFLSQVEYMSTNDLIKRQRIDSLKLYMSRCLNFNLHLAGLRRNEGFGAALAYASSIEGKYSSSRTLELITLIQKDEKQLLKLRQDTNKSNSRIFNLLTLSLFIITICCMIGLIVFSRYCWIQNTDKAKKAGELLIANKKVKFRDGEKRIRASELHVANIELIFQNEEKQKRSDELILANIELAFQNSEKEKRATELSIANIELAFQNIEKGKRADELTLANIELAFQNNEKEKRATELILANEELGIQNKEKEKRAMELILANKELAYQNKEKEKREIEIMDANKELLVREEFQREYIKGLEKMMYMISHEVRQPIAHLLGLVSLFEQSLHSSTAALAKIINYIKTAVTSLDVYTRDLTAFVGNMMHKGKR